MTDRVADLTPAELRAIVREAVHEQLIEVLGDPDEGLEVRPDFLRLLEERRKRVAAQDDTVSLDEALAAAKID